MEARAADIAGEQCAGTGLAAGASSALHIRHQRQDHRSARAALSDVCQRTRRANHLSRTRPAGGLCDARPEAKAARCAGLCRGPRAVDHPHACRLQRARRAARGSRRRLGQEAGQGLRASRTRSPPSACNFKRWVSLHGISINVEPDLTHFDAIVPCGVADPRYGVTGLADLGHLADHGGCRHRAPAELCRGVRLGAGAAAGSDLAAADGDLEGDAAFQGRRPRQARRVADAGGDLPQRGGGAICRCGGLAAEFA